MRALVSPSARIDHDPKKQKIGEKKMTNKTFCSSSKILLALILIKPVTLLLLAVCMSACSAATGWQMHVGFAPVKQIDHRQQLTQEPTRKDDQRKY